MVNNEEVFVATYLDILVNPDRAEAMKRNCSAVVRENQGATRKNLDKLQEMLESIQTGR